MTTKFSFVGLLVILSVITEVISDTCQGRCDDTFDSSFSCQCNSACYNHNDCCNDYESECNGGDLNSCAGRCGIGYDNTLPCQCNDKCSQYGNCCQDFDSECDGGSTGGGLTNEDLLALGELLIGADINNVGGMIELNLQCTTNNGNPNDCSSEPLFSFVDPSVLEMPIYVKLAALYDNYVSSPSSVEDHTQQEQQEEADFMQEVCSSPVTNATHSFLVEKGAFTGTQQDWCDHIHFTWFTMYDRAKSTLGSSGFEHVFIGEKKGGKVGGFHNWFHWYLLEQAGDINYLGYWQTAEFGPDMWRGGGISFTYNWDGTPKPYGSMFLATSPELELALYTVCLMNRPNAKCHTSMMGQDVFIQTWEENVGGNILPGSSYPDWDA